VALAAGVRGHGHRARGPGMIVAGNIAAGEAPTCPPGSHLLAAIDVEWAKNYRIRGGNVPFCFSVTWLALPADGDATVGYDSQFWYTSAYVEDPAERGDLVTAADSALRCLASHASLIAGHQLCSDLAVLAAASAIAPAIREASAAWRQRRCSVPGQPAFLDTRYDAGHILACTSRRLVDVCTDLQLDVTQPELRGTSMTALHRRWLQAGDVTAREKITVLNLRHSLSTAIIAARAAGLANWTPALNVNQLLARQLGSELGWTASPAFTALLGDPGAA
jgi:hypothetical protein